MEGRKHSGVVVTTVVNADPPQAQAWEQRWRKQPAPAVVDTGAVDHGIGFRQK